MIKTEPQTVKFGPLQSAESEALLRREVDARLPIPADVDRPSIAPLVDRGSSIVPSQVDSGNLPPRVDRKG